MLEAIPLAEDAEVAQLKEENLRLHEVLGLALSNPYSLRLHEVLGLALSNPYNHEE